jgi:hypothetical protein
MELDLPEGEVYNQRDSSRQTVTTRKGGAALVVHSDY